jgi:ferric iron reductase protein FhuF
MDSLSLNEQENLKKFRVYFHKEHPQGARSLHQFMNTSEVTLFLKDGQNEIGSSLPKVTASLISKRLAFIAVAHLYTMTVYNASLSSEPQDWMIISKKKNDLWIPHFYLKEDKVERLSGDRDSWKTAVVQKWINQLIFPAVHSLCNATGLSKKTLWENIRIYIDWLYLDVLSEIEDESNRKIVQEDYRWLTDPTKEFLKCSEEGNPFVACHNLQKGQRETCCLSHLLDRGAKKCNNCPLLEKE